MIATARRRRIVLGLSAATVLTAGAVSTGAFAHEVSNTAKQVVVRHPSPTPATTDVRWARHDGFDRITFQFSGKAPGYDVRYVTSPSTCAQGNSVSLGTARYLQVRFTPATGHSYGTGTSTIGLPTLKKIKKTCDFEADTTWLLGVDHKAGFHVKTLTSPTRIYVDIAH